MEAGGGLVSFLSLYVLNRVISFFYLVSVRANYRQGILFNPYGVVTLL